MPHYFPSNVEKSSKAAAGPCRNTKAQSNNQEEAAVQWLWGVTAFLVLFLWLRWPHSTQQQEGNKTYNAEGLGITYFKARGWPWIISSQLFHLVSLQSADLHSITSAQDP